MFAQNMALNDPVTVVLLQLQSPFVMEPELDGASTIPVDPFLAGPARIRRRLIHGITSTTACSTAVWLKLLLATSI